jgi:hypothetical protein
MNFTSIKSFHEEDSSRTLITSSKWKKALLASKIPHLTNHDSLVLKIKVEKSMFHPYLLGGLLFL